ncbi:MAG: hypothetical protein QM756_27770 [Polyangiaceae bacterium]
MTLMRVGSGLLAVTVLSGALLGGAGCVSSSDDATGGTASTSGGATGSSGGSTTTSNGGSTTTSSGGASTTGETGALVCGTAQELITDFTYTAGATTSTTDATFGDFTMTFSGGTFVYPNGTTATYPLTSDVTMNNWHVTGNVGDYSGMGLYFANDCAKLDASAFTGISFTISGTLPAGMQSMKLSVGTAGDSIPSSWLKANGEPAAKPNFGRCMPVTPNNKYDGTCGAPEASFTVTSTPTTVTIKWADFDERQARTDRESQGAHVHLVHLAEPGWRWRCCRHHVSGRHHHRRLEVRQVSGSISAAE